VLVSEGEPSLSDVDVRDWLRSVRDGPGKAIGQDSFQSEEIEYGVTGVWDKPTAKPRS